MNSSLQCVIFSNNYPWMVFHPVSILLSLGCYRLIIWIRWQEGYESLNCVSHLSRVLLAGQLSVNYVKRPFLAL